MTCKFKCLWKFRNFTYNMLYIAWSKSYDNFRMACVIRGASCVLFLRAVVAALVNLQVIQKFTMNFATNWDRFTAISSEIFSRITRESVSKLFFKIQTKSRQKIFNQHVLPSGYCVTHEILSKPRNDWIVEETGRQADREKVVKTTKITKGYDKSRLPKRIQENI